MGYDVHFIQVPTPPGICFPVAADKTDKLLAGAVPFQDLGSLRASLLKIDGCRRGSGDAIDYLGKGLSYARLVVRKDAIHVENNCSAGELIKIYKHLVEAYPPLVILDLQSRQVHDADSLMAWWSRPL